MKYALLVMLALSPFALASPTTQPRTGRFDTNDLINLYDRMSKDFGNTRD